MKSLHTWVPVAVMMLLLAACTKQSAVPTQLATDNSLIDEARQLFTQTTAHPPATNPDNPYAGGRIPRWAGATIAGHNVIVPLDYSKPYFLQLAGSQVFFPVTVFSQLLCVKDSSGAWSFTVQLRLPDSLTLADPLRHFTGTVLEESWAGYPTRTYRVVPAEDMPARNARVLTVCNTLNGYNYPANSPGDGYSWSRTVCTSMNIPDTQDGGAGSGGNGGSGGSGGSGSSSNATLAFTPKLPLTDIPNYLNCFTNNPNAQYTVMVCVDQPKAGSRTPWGFSGVDMASLTNPFDVGHTFLVLTQTNGLSSTVRNVGFYPNVSILKPWAGDVPGVYNDDGMHHYDISARFSLSAANFMALLQYIKDSQNKPYNLSTNNCTTFALNALDAGHIYLPRTLGGWPWGVGNDPGDLGEDIRNSNAPGILKSTSEQVHINSGGCSTRPSAY